MYIKISIAILISLFHEGVFFIEEFECHLQESEADQGQQTSLEAVEISTDCSLQDGKVNEKGKDGEVKDKEKNKDIDKEKGKEKDGDRKVENEKEKLKNIEGTNLDALLQRLPGCVSRDLIDQLTVITSFSPSLIVIFLKRGWKAGSLLRI